METKGAKLLDKAFNGRLNFGIVSETDTKEGYKVVYFNRDNMSYISHNTIIFKEG